MIDAFRVLGWLNAIDSCSYLNNEDRKLIDAVSKLGLFDFRIESIVDRLRTAAYVRDDPYRKAEILLHCATIGHSRGWFPQAAHDAREALTSYGIDNHRRAVALWILGIVQWDMLQNHEAHKNWAEARKTFKQCQVPSQHSGNSKDWYEDPIQRMEVELIARPEEISTWLNRFERSSLRPPTGQIVNLVRKKIRQREYPNIYVLMQDLENAYRRSEKIYERAEIYLEFGLATYQMGHSYFAIELLRKAVLNFYPGIGAYHKQVVARCMLGALEWMHRSSHNQAAADWLHCVEEFDNLREWADRENFQEKEEWYAEQGGLLRTALLEWVEPPDQIDPDKNFPEAQGTEYPPSPVNPGKTDLYQELLAKVEWDRSIADHLIEFERKKAPTTDRKELIRRALEGLIRDNQ